MVPAMPLSEVGPNHVRRNGQIGQAHSQENDARAGMQNDTKSPKTFLKPSSVHSMLKNTTEIGDVGQFSSKTSRLPSSIPRPLAGLPGKPRTPGKTYQSGPYHHGSVDFNGRHRPMLSPNGSVSSKHSQRQFRGPRRVPSYEDYRTKALTQSSRNPNIRYRAPHIHQHSQTELQDNRSRSPFAYPTRLKRPGYRPSSPALSDLSRLHAQRSPSVHHDPASRTASPSSSYFPSRSQSPWQASFNRSDSMLQQYPYNVVLDSNGHQSPSVYSTRQSTPKLPRSLRSPASLSQLPRKLSKSKAGKLRSNSPPVTPTFYDYTEDFDDQDNFANVSVSTAILFEQSTPEAASNTYFELDQSPNNSGPPELPSDSSSPKPPSCREDDENDLLPTGLETVGGGWIRAGGQDLSDVLELPEKEGTSDHGDQRTEKQNAISQKNRIRHLRLRQVSAHEAETVADRPGTDEDFKSPAIADLDGKVEASGVHPAAKDGYPSQRPPSLLLKYSQRHGPHIATPNNLEIHDAAALSQRELKTPKPTRDSTAILPSVNKAASVDDIRGSSSEDHSGHGLTEILSPTPERSITSPVARDRFSKILSIDESLISLNNLGSPSKKAERNIDSHQVRVPQSEIGNVVPSSREQLSRDRSIYFRKPVKPSSAAPILVEASDSDDEPELTNALRTTFCNTESQAPNIAAGSSLSTLPSQRASRVSRPPSSLRRTPAKRKSDRHLSTSSVVTLATPSQKEKPQTQSAPKRGEDESSNEVPVFNREESIRVDRSLNAEASATGERSLPELDKELPPLPRKQPSLKAFSPPAHSSPTALPFSFSPLINKRREDLTIAELEAVTSSYLEQEEKKDASDTSQYTPLKSKTVPKRKSAASLLSLALKLNSDRESAASPISSRPWNLDTSYPWDDEAPKLEVNLPESIDSSQVTAGKVPRFKLKIQRASTLTGVSRRRSKQASSVDGFSPSDILPGPAFRRKKHPPPPLFPTNMNSSHDILRPSLQRTRFVERFDQPASPATLMPNSAGPEVRSFFSDDSSLPQPKGSLRKRLSDFRARTVRAVSMDQNRGYDRGLLSSTFGISRASGRSSRQSQHTAGASSHTSQVRHVQWNVVSKIKEWFQKSEDRVRDWRWRIRYRKGRTRAASTPLYAGV